MTIQFWNDTHKKEKEPPIIRLLFPKVKMCLLRDFQLWQSSRNVLITAGLLHSLKISLNH